MTDFAALISADHGQQARPIHLVDKKTVGDWVKTRPAQDRALIEAQRFNGEVDHAFVLLPRGPEFEVVSAVKNVDGLSPWCLATLAEKLPEGTYKLANGSADTAALSWLLGQHAFDVYRSRPESPLRGPRVLVTAASAIGPAVSLAQATALVRDLVNTPAADLGPAELEKAVKTIGTELGAAVRVIAGKDLAEGYPLIAAVGGAASADRAPRLIELEWGKAEHPRIAIVGKGVCFDSGGLDLKPASGMRLMKKDMGGAAHALALARLVISAKLPVRVHLLIPAVENAVGGAAYRPGDIVKSRRGLFVEIDNTDAEGRLVLADALTKAAEAEPELILDFATLTGAARIALGPDLPAFFTNDEDLASATASAADGSADPVWRMPLWDPYDEMLRSDIADMANSANSPMAGCIVAAMFLKRFVPEGTPWTHLDTYAWRDTAKPGRPKGGEALGLRTMFSLLQDRYPAHSPSN